MKFALALALVVGSALTMGSAWSDDHVGEPMAKRFYLTPGIAFFTPPDEKSIGIDDGGIGPAVGLGFGLSDHWAAELLGMRTDLDYVLPGGSGSDNAQLVWLDLLYKFNKKGPWQPFVLFGGGKTEIEFDNVRKKFDDNQYNAGLGVFGHLSNRILLRGDVRGVHSREEGGLEPFAFVGLTALLGSVEPPKPADTDGDGVPDESDRCPNTPPGTTVGADGCEIDSDRDGVADSADACPNTRRGAKVDARGCELDSDGDGVPDGRDKCPNTKRGATVNSDGCVPQPKMIEEAVTIDLNLEFDTNRAELRPTHFAEIATVVDFLKQFPTSRAVIEGHTDNTGADDYNQSLSERRAKTVLDYVVSKGISASRLSWKGYGESRPIDTNATSAGRQHNRRVSAVVSGTHKVNQ